MRHGSKPESDTRLRPAAWASHRTITAKLSPDRFREVVDLFGEDHQETPAGFRIEMATHGSVTSVDLVRDIGYERGGTPRPTPLLFSADSANPYEVSDCAPLIANVTCNPGIVYDLFINNPDANIGGHFTTLDEVLVELSKAAGPGCDVSVEIANPYGDINEILEEVARYEEILTRHRLVVKVPHTGPLSADTAGDLLKGNGLLRKRYNSGAPRDMLRGHALARQLHDLGHRVNFTLMFEPHQTPLALQARPYFINAFVRHRADATRRMRGFVAAYDATSDEQFVADLRDYLVRMDYLGTDDKALDLLTVLRLTRTLLRQRDDGPDDGMDSVRRSLRWLSTTHLPETRLIVCSMDGEQMFPDLMTMLSEPEFHLHRRVLVTADPAYLARWTTSPRSDLPASIPVRRPFGTGRTQRRHVIRSDRPNRVSTTQGHPPSASLLAYAPWCGLWVPGGRTPGITDGSSGPPGGVRMGSPRQPGDGTSEPPRDDVAAVLETGPDAIRPAPGRPPHRSVPPFARGIEFTQFRP
jgi:hypothetical protein